jgi:hypothetical protein
MEIPSHREQMTAELSQLNYDKSKTEHTLQEQMEQNSTLQEEKTVLTADQGRLVADQQVFSLTV